MFWQSVSCAAAKTSPRARPPQGIVLIVVVVVIVVDVVLVRGTVQHPAGWFGGAKVSVGKCSIELVPRGCSSGVHSKLKSYKTAIATLKSVSMDQLLPGSSERKGLSS